MNSLAQFLLSTKMKHTIRFEDQTVEVISALLAADGERLTAEQVLARARFVERIGGVENARKAVKMLRDLENAA